jgi:hypothetical protein
MPPSRPARTSRLCSSRGERGNLPPLDRLIPVVHGELHRLAQLYFLTAGGTKLNAATVAASKTLEVGAPVVLFEIPRGSTYAPAPDGKTFYVTVSQPPTRPKTLMVLVNWLGR